MPYLNLDPNFSNHPKAMRLNARLGANTHLLMVNLWCFAARFHPDDGNLSDYTSEEIESFAVWAGNKQCFYNACVEVGFIDVKRDGKLVMLHDWKEHQGHLSALRERAQKAAKARWGKIRNQQQNSEPVIPQEDNCNAPSNTQAMHRDQQAMLDEYSFPSSPSSPSLPSEKEKKEKKEKKDKDPKFGNFGSPVSDLTSLLSELILKNKPDRTQPNVRSENWKLTTAQAIDKMIRIDKRTPERIEGVIRWCQGDTEPRGNGNFCWAPNVLSGQKLRKQFDRLEEEMTKGSFRTKSDAELVEEVCGADEE